MPFAFTLLLALIGISGPVFAYEVSGPIELKTDSADAGRLIITGRPAQVLWDGMTDVDVSKASRVQPSDMKIGRHIDCEFGVDPKSENPKVGEYLCTLRISNITKGAVE